MADARGSRASERRDAAKGVGVVLTPRESRAVGAGTKRAARRPAGDPPRKDKTAKCVSTAGVSGRIPDPGAGDQRARLRGASATRGAAASRAVKVLAGLRKSYADAECALRHASAYQLLVATILSAQCTDERVNQVTPAFFQAFPNVRSLSEASAAEVEALIRSTGFYRNKTRNLLAMARTVCERFGGEIPATMDELVTLGGVARKTANCVLGTWFGKNEGVVVDTHVGRLALRLGLSASARDGKDAVRIEQDLMRLFPRESWTFLSHALIEHGRRVCVARSPRCGQCEFSADCPSAFSD